MRHVPEGLGMNRHEAIESLHDAVDACLSAGVTLGEMVTQVVHAVEWQQLKARDIEARAEAARAG